MGSHRRSDGADGAYRGGQCRLAQNDVAPRRVVVAMLVGQDPAVDQAWQDGSGVKPVARMPPVTEKAKGLVACGGDQHLVTGFPEGPDETVPKSGIGLDDQDALPRLVAWEDPPDGGVADARPVQSGTNEAMIDVAALIFGLPVAYSVS
jgi:hypothetical protein